MCHTYTPGSKSVLKWRVEMAVVSFVPSQLLSELRALPNYSGAVVAGVGGGCIVPTTDSTVRSDTRCCGNH